MNTYYLQMSAPDDLVAAAPRKGLCLRLIDPPDGAVNERFYKEVGKAWNWTACAEWTARRWEAYLADNPVSTVVLVMEPESVAWTVNPGQPVRLGCPIARSMKHMSG